MMGADMSKNTQRKSYFSFQWHITDECDQRCKHCYIFSGDGCKALKSMTWEQMQKVVDNCEDFCRVYNRIPYFYITGGDPILHPKNCASCHGEDGNRRAYGASEK